MSTNHPLDKWRQWGFDSRPEVIKEYSSGLNHSVYLVRDNESERVLKIYSKGTQDAVDSIAIQQYAASIKLAPSVIRWSQEYCLMEHAAADIQVDKLTALKQTAKALRKLHNLEIAAHQFDLNQGRSEQSKVSLYTPASPNTRHPEQSEGSPNTQANPNTRHPEQSEESPNTPASPNIRHPEQSEESPNTQATPNTRHPEQSEGSPNIQANLNTRHPEQSEGSPNTPAYPNHKLTQRFNLMAFYKEYLGKINDPALNKQHRQLSTALELFCSDSTPPCLCHNDLVQENIISNTHATQFIDWDYAQLNNPLFDLAYVVIYQNLSDIEQGMFLESYFEDKSRGVNNQQFAAAQVSVLWLDLLWCRVAGLESSIEQVHERLASQLCRVELSGT